MDRRTKRTSRPTFSMYVPVPWRHYGCHGEASRFGVAAKLTKRERDISPSMCISRVFHRPGHPGSSHNFADVPICNIITIIL